MTCLTSRNRHPAVLARCFQLQEGLAVLEFDRVLDAEPDELDRHRLGLQVARQKRRRVHNAFSIGWMLLPGPPTARCFLTP